MAIAKKTAKKPTKAPAKKPATKAKAASPAPAYANLVRQGDVLLQRISSIAVLAEKPIKDPRGVVLAEGSTSGHYHAVIGRGAKLFAYSDARIEARVLVVGAGGAEVRVIGGGSGGVPRHEPIRIQQGTYQVRVQRAYSSATSRRVED